MEPQKPILISIPTGIETASQIIVIVRKDRGVTPPEGLLYIMDFHENGKGNWIAAAQASTKLWGYISADGEWVVPPTLDDARTFSNGVARFCKNDLWGYLNLQGEIIIEPQFLYASPFRSGLASVATKNQTYRIIDLQGNFTCNNHYAVMLAFGENGLAAAAEKISKKRFKNIGYVNSHGEWVIPPSFYDAYDFGKHSVAIASKKEDYYGLIDCSGQWVLEPYYRKIYPFNKYGLARFYATPGLINRHLLHHGDYGYFNTRGETIIPCRYHDSTENDNMPCGLLQLNCCYFKTNGEKLSIPDIAGSYPYFEGVKAAIAKVYHPTNHKLLWALLDTDGELRLVPENLLEPLADSRGSIVQPQFETPAIPFINQNREITWINHHVEALWKAEFKNDRIFLSDANNNLLWCSEKNSNYQPPPIVFNAPKKALPPLEDFFVNIKELGDVATYAETLLRTSESRLHQFSQGIKLNYKDQNLYENYGYHPDSHYDYEYEELFEFTEEELAEEGVTPDQLQSYAICERQQLMRAYLAEDNNEDDMRDHLFSLTNKMHLKLIAELTCKMGLPEMRPKHISYWGPQYKDEIEAEVGWKFPLVKPLEENEEEDNSAYQWITVYKSTGGAGGDNFFSIWLMASPSQEAINLALKIKNRTTSIN